MSVVSRRVSQVAAHIAASPTASHAAARTVATEAAKAKLPEMYFGTMTFGWNQASKNVDDVVALAMTRKYLSSGGIQVDTARIYSGGDTEDILGRVLKDSEVAGREMVLTTKAHPSQPEGLSKQGIHLQLQNSLKTLQVNKVDVLYLHQPDTEHDLVESLECLQDLIREGTIARYGMSNYSAVEMERCCLLCKENGWQLPSYFQGLYNPLNRLAEEELLPVLRKHGVAFIAFNPLAAGLLSGKHKPGGDVLPGRFKDNPNYLPRFYTDQNFQALSAIGKACAEHGLGMVPATYSWLLQHSQLDATKGDGLLLGASSMEQLEENIIACNAPATLPAPVISAFDGAWAITKEGAFPYWRSYSKDQPGRESMHPGASYNAAKTT